MAQYTYAAEPDWSEQARLPGVASCEVIHRHEICLVDGNRQNIYNLQPEQWSAMVQAGAKHAVSYPVEITRLQLPKTSMQKFFTSSDQSPMRRFIFSLAKKLTRFRSFEDIFDWLGLNKYPQTQQSEAPNLIPTLQGFETTAMGVTSFNHEGHQGITISCAGCHSSDLFGVKVMGLTNRFSRANEAFILGKKALSKTPALLFKTIFNPVPQDLKIFEESKKAMSYVRLKKPLALGLDTSLAQVGLSLAARADDEYASLKRVAPRRSALNSIPADSKPAVWWNLKYKTKWLSDGSVLSGNPIHTNFIWNEIGRGQDLEQLENWFRVNQKKVRELTAYVFSTEAPQYNDFFPGEINISLAKKGQQIFLNNCKGCHGVYEKGWDLSNEIAYEEKIQTTKVRYHQRTIVKNVGTDSYRAKGMRYFYQDLNKLKISQQTGIVVQPQNGYVPPPLVGIWSRYPYLHNNSVPTLYDLLTPDFDRPQTYISVPAIDKRIDFDTQKVGYPSPARIRPQYRENPEYFFNSKRKGMSNRGHTTMLLHEDGTPKFDHQKKLQLIEFLKTL